MKNYLLIILLLCMGTYSSYGQKKQLSNYNFKRAEELWKNNGDPKEILDLLNKQLEETPKNADAFFLRSYIYVMQEKFNLALSDVNHAISYYNKKTSERNKGALYLWRGAIYYKQLADVDKALADYNTAYKLIGKKISIKLVHYFLNGPNSITIKKSMKKPMQTICKYWKTMNPTLEP